MSIWNSQAKRNNEIIKMLLEAYSRVEFYIRELLEMEFYYTALALANALLFKVKHCYQEPSFEFLLQFY
jgi:hypothetical protein